MGRVLLFFPSFSFSQCREDKLQELKRQQVLQLKDTSCSDGEEFLDETSAFIELSPNNLSKVPEKGILKRAIRSDKEKWSDEASQSDNQDIMSQAGSHAERNSDALTEVERTLKSLNGYHEDILEALQTVSSHRPVESQGSPQDSIKKTYSDVDYGILKNSLEHLQNSSQDEVEEMVPPCGPIRIRNLEDLLRKLEHQPIHVSPAGSDMRLSEPEADRHYRVERTDSASGTESQLEPGLQFYIGSKQRSPAAGGFNRVPPVEPEEDDEDFDEEGSIYEDGEDRDYSPNQFVRSASEEALPISTYKPEYGYERNLNSKQPPDKVVKGFEYVPSPPSDELYDGLYDDKGYFPPSTARSDRVAPLPVTAPPSSSSSTSGSQPPSGAKKKGKKKFPEYKV